MLSGCQDSLEKKKDVKKIKKERGLKERCQRLEEQLQRQEKPILRRRKRRTAGEGRNTIKIAHFGELDLKDTIIQQLCCLDPIVRKRPGSLPPRCESNHENKTLQKDYAVFTSTAVVSGGNLVKDQKE